MTPQEEEFIRLAAYAAAGNAMAFALIATHEDKPALKIALQKAAQAQFDNLLQWNAGGGHDVEERRALLQSSFDAAFGTAMRLV
jgi:hypothetical protein